MTQPEAAFVEAIRAVVAAMLPDPQVITGTVETVTVRGGVLVAVGVHCDDEVLPCDVADAVRDAALAGDIRGRQAVVALAGAPLALALYSIGDG